MWPASWGGLHNRRGAAGPAGGAGLTNRIALWLGLVLLAGIGADLAFNDAAALVFLARKFLELIEWVAFWR